MAHDENSVKPADAGPVERPVRPLVERLRDIAHGMNAAANQAALREAADEIERLRSYKADALRFRMLIRSTGNELVLGTPGKPHKLQISLNVEGCEQYSPDGAIDFPATIRAVLDDEQQIQDSWAEKKA
jgi:hypothetical protein